MNWLELASPLFDLSRATTGLAVNWLIQSTLLVSGGLMLGYLLRDRGSAVQSAIYRTTLVAVLASPVATWALSLAGFSGWSLQMPEAYQHESITVDAPANAPPLIEPLVVQPAATAAGFQPTFDSLASVAEPGSTFEHDSSELTQSEEHVLDAQPVPPIAEDGDQSATVQTIGLSQVRSISVHGFGFVAVAAGALWLVAGGFLLCRLGLAWWKLNRLRRSAWAAEPRTLDVCRELASLLDVLPPDVLHSPYLPSPCLAGLRRPAVLLPEAEMSLPVRDVLVHELAHLRRHDCWWNLLRRVGTALLFFQPLLWKLSRRLDSTAEEVCDDYVVQFGGDRRQYAHRLVDIAELSLAPAAAAGVGIVSLRSMLATRVVRIMDTSRSLSTRVGHALLALVLLCGLIGTMLAGFVGVTPASPPPAIEDIASEEKSETAPGSTPAEVTESAEEPAEQTDDIQTVRGRVVDAAGNPIAGARVTATQMRWLDDQWLKNERRHVGETSTGANGQFEITVPKLPSLALNKNRFLSFDWKPVTITATAAGHTAAWIGGDWYQGDEDPLADDVTLQLEKESPSIRGRLVNLEGQPQAGLSVKVMSLAAAEPGKVKEWQAAVEELRRNGKLPRADNNGATGFVTTAMVVDHTDDAAQEHRKAYFPTKWRLLPGDPNFPPPVRTDSEGRFELAGLPPDCLAVLEISGPGVATQSASVVTRPMETLDVPNTGLAGDNAHGYHGLEFDHAVAPGTSIFGTITDAESGEPIPGVQVDVHPIVNRMQIRQSEWTNRTDELGRYRIEGLPIGGEMRLDVIPAPDQPYLLIEGNKVAESPEFEPIEANFKLRRGILVRGKVTVAETGEPVDATLDYHPFLNNDFAKQYQKYDSRVFRFEGNDTRHRTGADGSFQTVVIPGRGILAVQTSALGEYCTGLGSESIKTNEEGLFPTYNFASPGLYQRVLEIDVPADAQVLEYNLTVSRGVSVRYALTDEQGQPLSGVLASGIMPYGGLPEEESEETSVEFKALRPGETRRVALLHRERRLGRILEVMAPQSAQTRPEPQSVTLLPCATVTGRLVNGEGEPVAGLMLSAYALPLGHMNAISPQQAVTDANGEFRMEYLPVGARYRALGNSPEYGSVELFSDLELEPGETIELGKIDVSSDKRPQPQRIALNAAAPAANNSTSDNPTAQQSTRDATSAAAKENDDDPITIRGRVVDPDGKPFAGAAVQVSWLYWSSELNHVALETTTSGEDGRFTISYRKLQLGTSFRRPDASNEVTIIASADGFGPAWIERNKLKNGEEPTLQLARDDVPITGRVVDLEGNPVPGVSVRTENLYSFANEDLTPFLDSLRRGELNWQAANRQVGTKWIPHDATSVPEAVVTDADGRFQISGVGRERRLAIELRGPGVALTKAEVATRPMEPIDANTGVADPEWTKKITLYGANFEIAVQPTQPITGTVRDAATGRPLAGVDVHSYRMTDRGMSAQKDIRVTSDANGRYRLVGMPKGTGRQIIAVPNDDQPYLMREFDVPDEPGLEAVDFDLELHRGVWITGRVTDKESGKPLGSPAQVWLYYLPYRTNQFADALPEYDVHGNVDGYQDRYTAKADGSYRLVGLPGKAIVGLSCWHMSYPKGMGSELIKGVELDEGGHFQTFRAPLSPSRKWPTAMKEIDIAEGTEAIELNFELDAGGSLEIKMVDADGQEISGVSILGLHDRDSYWQAPDASTVKALAFAPHERRTMLFHHKERNLGQVVFAEAKEKSSESITVKLEPCATIRGRLVDDNDQPITDASIRFDIRPGGDFEPSLPSQGTDGEGRFEHPNVLPGANYAVLVESPRLGFKVAAKDVAVKPGETVDLGTIDITSDARPEPARMMADTANRDNSNALQVKEVEQIDSAIVEASGRVLNPDGAPASGADVLFAPRYGATQADLKVRATTNADGRFKFTFPQSDLARLAEGLRSPWNSPYIVARMNGSGPVRKHIVEPADAKDITLKLVPDDIPIEGRIVDLEGQPVANAALRILRVEGNPNGTLDAWLQNLRNFGEFWNSGDTWLQESLTQDISGLPAEARTDAEGRFTLRGMGRERVVDMRLEAPRLESTEISVMSRAEGAITVPLEKEQPELGTYLLYNSTFTHSAAPSQPVEGVVRDADNGEPIAGVTLYCAKRAGRDIHGRYAPETKTDERGRYVLNGLPKGTDNKIAIIPPIGTPYVPQNVVMDTSQGLETKTVDIELQAAALIRGRVTDEATGKPVANARVEYFAAIANESIVEYSGFRDADDIATTTNGDGEYEIIGLPGRGFLAIRAASDEFAAGQRIDVKSGDYDENPGRLRDTLFRTHPRTCIAEQHHAVAAVEVPAGARNVTRDVVLGRGATRKSSLLDPEGYPLIGVKINRRGIYACEWYGGDVTLNQAEFTVYGLNPDKPRSLFLKHEARGLVAALVVNLDAEEPIEIRLQPGGMLVGRLVDEDDKPVAHATLHGRLADGQGELDGFFFRASTDEAGRFRVADLIPELKYQLRYHRSGREYVLLKSKDAATVDVTVSAGEVNEVGDVQAFDPRAKASMSSTHKGTQMPTITKSGTLAAGDAADDRIQFGGRVVGPDGKPASEAYVAVFAASTREQRGGDLGRRDEVLAEAMTNADGRYELALDGVSSKTHRYAAIIARADGSALAWRRFNLDDAKAEVSLELVAEQPIRGRLVDIEGRPAGGVRMHYRAVMPTSKDGKFESGVGFREFNNQPAAWPQPVVSDDQGRFVLHGLAAGQGVSLVVEASDRFAPQDIALNTGLPEQRGASDGTYRSQVVRNLKPGEEPVLALAPAQIFEGVVTYDDTGKPAPHARLTIWASQQKFGSMYSVPGKADAEGRYRISPYPGIRFGITAYPPDGAPYLIRQLPPVDWEDSDTIKKVDVTLPRGVLIRGKIVEAGSGGLVAAATIQYVPEEANPNDADDILTGWQGIQLSNDEGEFEIVVLAGPGSLLVHGRDGEYILQESSSSQLSRGTPGGERRYAHAFERINPQSGSEPVDIKIQLLPAKKVAGLIVDESGAPVDEALMITRLHITPHSPFWRGFPVELFGGRFELDGLAANEQYPTHFLDAKRRLGATVVLKADDEPPTVVLKPCGQATARFVDAEGQPHDGFRPMLEMVVAPGTHKYDIDAMKRGELTADSDYVSNIDRINHWSGPPTDDQGRVTFPALIPGATYRLGRIEDGKGVIVKDFSVGSGESLDLGDIVMRLEN